MFEFSSESNFPVPWQTIASENAIYYISCSETILAGIVFSIHQYWKNFLFYSLLLFQLLCSVWTSFFVQNISAKHPIPHVLIIIHPENLSENIFYTICLLCESKSRPWARNFVFLFAMLTISSSFPAANKHSNLFT